MKLRRTALVALTASVAAAAAAPALAADGANNVSVSLTASAGTRQFDVLNSAGTAALTALDLGTTGSQAFRTRVRDNAFNPAALVNGVLTTKPYSVTATMSNLYREVGSGNDVTTKIPSSQLSLAQGTLGATDLVATLTPRLALSGTLENCEDLPSDVLTSLGLSLVGNVLSGLTGTVATLCTQLGTSGQVVTGTVDGAVRSVTTAVSDVTKLPTPLTNGAGGAFTNADYSQDAVAQTDSARTGAPTATGVSVMQGTAGTTLPAALATSLQTAVSTALSSVPLVTSTDTGAETTLSRVRTAVSGVDSALATTIGNLTASQQAALLGTLTSTPLAPVLADLSTITSDYSANPTLNANMTAPVPGVYEGTLTLTFVQS